MLKRNGFAVPAADHPPETRNRSRYSKELSSSDEALESPTTWEYSIKSSSATASSPCSTPEEAEDKDQISRKRSLSLNGVATGCGRASKRQRDDSLIEMTDTKIGTHVDSHLKPSVHFSEIYDVNQTRNATVSSGPPAWSTAQFQTQYLPVIQSMVTAFSTCRTWNDDPSEPQEYISHPVDMQYGQNLHLDRQSSTINSIARREVTNLDYMPLKL